MPNKINRKMIFDHRLTGGGGVAQEIGAMDLAAICVAVLRSVLEYNVAWLDITPFLPICLVQ